jgi:hypothetical protein
VAASVSLAVKLNWLLIRPKVFEPILRQRGVQGGVLDLFVSEVGLQLAYRVAVIRELVAAGVAQHVGVGLNLQPGGDGCTLHHGEEGFRCSFCTSC